MADHDKKGIKESKELLEGLLDLTCVLLEIFKDGAQMSDAYELWKKIGNDYRLKASFKAAFDGYNKVPSELEDLELAETLELVQCVLLKLPKLMECMRKEAEKK